MELTISYSQLMLMNYDGEQPYVDWTDEDFDRGYAKADGTVIFEALSDYTCEVKVTCGKHIEKEEVVRTVTVPFTVKNECIVVTSILANKFQIPIPNGEYTVVLQATPLEEPTDDDLYKIQYKYYKNIPPEFETLIEICLKYETFGHAILPTPYDDILEMVIRQHNGNNKMVYLSTANMFYYMILQTS